MNPTIHSSSFTLKVLVVACLFFFLLAVFFGAKWMLLETKVAIKASQVAMMIETEEYARESNDPLKIARELSLLANRHPKSESTPLDIMIDCVKWNSVSNILVILRQKTGKEFGNDPQKWIEALNTETPATNSPRLDALSPTNGE
jgi:hypothetical protein